MIRLTVTNLGGDLEELALEDVVPPALKIVSGSPHHLISLSKAETFAFEYEVQGPRGAYPFERLSVEAGDHLGLLRLRKDIRTPGQLSVFPLLPRIREVRIRPRRTRVYAGTIPARVGGAGVEFFGVRPYLPGDPPRRVNWHASARHRDELYSNEFQQERVADVAIVLDGRERSNLYVGWATRSLSIPSWLPGAWQTPCCSRAIASGLLVYSQYLQWTLPGYGKIQRERILHALARAAPGASQIFEGLQYLPSAPLPCGVADHPREPAHRRRLFHAGPVARPRLSGHGGQSRIRLALRARLLPRAGAKYSCRRGRTLRQDRPARAGLDAEAGSRGGRPGDRVGCAAAF